MIQSMTGFGRAEAEVAGGLLVVELRTVNHRHLDVSARLPRALSALEPDVRRAAQAAFSRGKVDVSVSFGQDGRPAQDVELDAALAARYLAFAESLARDHGAAGSLGVGELLALPGVTRLVDRNLDERALREELLGATRRAAEEAAAMRGAEGEAIDRDLRGRLEGLATVAAEVETRAGEVAAAARERLRKRAAQLREDTGLLDEARLHQEVVIAADRLDVSEEVVRLRSHVAQFLAALDAAAPGDPVGRRLEFLLQEMGREVNTIGSKAGDAPIAHRVVDLKTELERVREQVLNVE